MANLAEVIGSVAAEAATMCTQCLIDHVTEESDELQDKLVNLTVATTLRRSTRDGEARYGQAFTEVITSVLVIAVFTAELSNHRAVAWKDTGQSAATVDISLN